MITNKPSKGTPSFSADGTEVTLPNCVWGETKKQTTTSTVYHISAENDFGNSRRPEQYETLEQAVADAKKKITTAGEYNDYHNEKNEVITKVTTIVEIIRVVEAKYKV